MATPEAVTRRRNTVIVGVAFVIVLVVAALFSVSASKGLPGSPKTTVRARFAQVGSQLQGGAEVTINGDRIGQVTDVTYDRGQAVVTMLLRGDHPMYANATATIADYALLGSEVLELSPGDPSTGRLVGDITETHTQSATDLENVLNVFTPPTRQALQTTVLQLGDGLAGQGTDLNTFLGAAPATLGDVGAITGAAASPQADLPGLLDSAKQLAGRFQDDDPLLTSLLTQTSATLAAVDVDGGQPLGQTIKALPPTLADANTALVALDQPLANLQSTLTELTPGAAALGEATPDIRGFLRSAPTPLGRIPGVAGEASPALLALSETMAYAQPLVPRLDEGLEAALPFLQVISPYGPDVDGVGKGLGGFTASHESSAQGNVYEHYARASFPVNFGALDLAGVTIPGVNAVQKQPRDPYPLPTQAYHDHEH